MLLLGRQQVTVAGSGLDHRPLQRLCRRRLDLIRQPGPLGGGLATVHSRQAGVCVCVVGVLNLGGGAKFKASLYLAVRYGLAAVIALLSPSDA